MSEMDSVSVGYDDSAESHDGGPAPKQTAYRVGELRDYVLNALESGTHELVLSKEGESGTYFVKQPQAAPIAVFKPAIEEMGAPANPHGHRDGVNRQGFQWGEGYKRECLAWLLDYGHFSNVPETVEVKINGKIGSLQRYIANTCEAWDVTPGRFSVSCVHRIGIFDIRTLNTDRHGGNLLIPKVDPTLLVPIDHSYILPSGFSDPDFEWMMWPQAKLPFQPAELQYIASLDPSADQQLVADTLGEESGEVIWLTTTILKMAAPRGYTLLEIASFCRRQTVTLPSALENVIAECRTDLDLGGNIDLELARKRVDERFPPRRTS